MKTTNFNQIKKIVKQEFDNVDQMKAFREYCSSRVILRDPNVYCNAKRDRRNKINGMSDLSTAELEKIYLKFKNIKFKHTQHNRRENKTISGIRTITNYISYNNRFLDRIIEQQEQSNSKKYQPKPTL